MGTAELVDEEKVIIEIHKMLRIVNHLTILLKNIYSIVLDNIVAYGPEKRGAKE